MDTVVACPISDKAAGRIKLSQLKGSTRAAANNGLVPAMSAKGLRCSALAIGQLETGGAGGRGKAVQDPQAGSLGGLQACEGQPRSGWCGWTVGCGVRGQPIG